MPEFCVSHARCYKNIEVKYLCIWRSRWVNIMKWKVYKGTVMTVSFCTKSFHVGHSISDLRLFKWKLACRERKQDNSHGLFLKIRMLYNVQKHCSNTYFVSQETLWEEPETFAESKFEKPHSSWWHQSAGSELSVWAVLQKNTQQTRKTAS